jgi:hypothetical protein
LGDTLDDTILPIAGNLKEVNIMRMTDSKHFISVDAFPAG